LRALEIARRMDEADHVKSTVETIGRLAWVIAVDADRSAGEFASALAAMQVALAEKTGNSNFLNTIGALHYRMGRFEEAIATLATSHAYYRQKYGAGSPTDLAFSAMAHARLGHEAEARAAMAELGQVVRDPRFADVPDAPRLLAEAEAVVAGQAARPAAGERDG
jgi:tetratricopeptide (TPR) repeat protein